MLKKIMCLTEQRGTPMYTSPFNTLYLTIALTQF